MTMTLENIHALDANYCPFCGEPAEAAYVVQPKKPDIYLQASDFEDLGDAHVRFKGETVRRFPLIAGTEELGAGTQNPEDIEVMASRAEIYFHERNNGSEEFQYPFNTEG